MSRRAQDVIQTIVIAVVLGLLVALMGWILSEAIEQGLLQALYGQHWRYRR